MSWNARRASFVLLAMFVAVSAVCLDAGRAQDKVKGGATPLPAPPDVPKAQGGGAGMNPDGFLNGGISLPKDEKGRGKALEAAKDYIDEEDWKVAIPELQKLLEIDEDVFVRLKRTNAEGKDIFVWVSAKKEADRLISTLPAAGLDYYKTSFGEKASGLLKKAKQTGDPAVLAQIMKRFAHTDAGGEAVKLLADYHFDRGNYIAALLCYNKLFSRQDADKLPAEVVAKAWAAARMSPASASSSTALGGNLVSAAELRKRLREGSRELKFGEQTVDLQDFEEYVGKLQRPGFDQNATDAIVFRATPNRSNQLVGGPAYMEANRRWRMYYPESEQTDPTPQAIETASDEENRSPTHTRIEAARKHLHNKHPIIPAFAPITVTVNKGDKKQPLLIYKNYYGIVARDLKTSEIAWASPSSWSLEKMLPSGANGDSGKTTHFNNWLNAYQQQYPQIVLENSTVGTLSTDGQFVYMIEDLAVPPLPNVNNVNMGFPGNNPNAGYPAELQDAISHSRLQAFGLASGGKLVWELGSEEKGPLSDCYFLGPPLPLAGKLYLLVDKQQELRLICLDPAALAADPRNIRGAILSNQALGTTEEKMEHDVFRRISAAHLAYGEGILVCPTNAGAVFGINLLENSLIWAYPYREKSDQPQQPQAINGRIRGGRGFIVGPNGMPVTASLTNCENRWKCSSPVIAEGKVVFTAPDAKSLHCINLRDGSPVWRRPKHDDDLYLANVYNGTVLIVGKKNVRGLSLHSGEVLWTIETGMPSGMGIGSDNVYYLPLKDGGKGKEPPQICAIDMEKGKRIGESEAKARGSEKKDFDVPGNLLFYEGDVISLGIDEITIYPQMKRKLAEMDDQLAKNPNDPIGLTERGGLRLSKGDLSGAIEDLSTALKNKPDDATRQRATTKLYDTLTTYIHDHFNEAEKYLDTYEELCKLDVEHAPAEKRAEMEAEQRRRRANFLWLVGKGREEQGRLIEAFEKYQEFGAKAGKQSELRPGVDDPQVKAAPDVWSRGRIIAMMSKATPENRAPLEKLIADKWDKLRQTNDLNELRSFVRMFGSVSDAGKEARLQLVERLMEQKDSAEEHPLLEAELELNQFRTGRHAPELAARATEALARLYTRKGLLEDAAYCYRKLGGEFAKVQVRDGKTGKQLYDNDAATDKRLLPYLDDPQPLGSVKFKGKKEIPSPGTSFNERQTDQGRFFQFEHSGENLPFFRHHLVGISSSGSGEEFKLFDRTLEDDKGAPREIFSKKVTRTGFQFLSRQVPGVSNQIRPNLPTGASARFPFQTLGHLIVLPVAHMVYGIDPVSHRVLWDVNLRAGGSGPEAIDPQNPNGTPLQSPPVVDPRDGSWLVLYRNNWSQRLGQAGPLQGRTICVQTRETLTALDPLTGRSLWSRTDVNPRNYLFADEEHIFVVELGEDNTPHATRVFRATDGITVRKVPDFGALFQRRLQVFGRHILLSEPGPGNGVLVRLYDALTGEDVWKQTYAARSLVARSEDPSLTAIVEPDGKVHVIDLATRKEVMVGQMEEPADQLRNVQIVHLLADRTNFYIACQAPTEGNNNPGVPGVGNQGILSSVALETGLRTIPVNGRLYSFARVPSQGVEVGDIAWHALVKNQFLILDQFQDLPLVLLTARQQVFANQPGRPFTQQVSVTSIEKHRGCAVFLEDKLPQNMGNFFAVRVDLRTSTVDLLAPNLKITHAPIGERKDSETRESRPGASAPATPKPQAQPAQPGYRAGRLDRVPTERVRIQEIAPPAR